MSEMTERTTPTPGSAGAVDLGCTCAWRDNHRGAGVAGNGEKFGWWISGDCPLHGGKAPKPDKGDDTP